MLTSEQLEHLATLRSDDGIISVFLRMEPRLAYERGLAATKFKSAYKRFRKREQRAKWLTAAEREYARILEFLETAEPDGRGLALFACEPASIWETVHLEVQLPSSVQVDATTRTGHLARVLDDHPRLAVVVAQRDKAVLHLSEQRERREQESIESEVAAVHDQGGLSQARFERRVELQVRQHLTEIVTRLEEIAKSSPFQRLFLAGTDEVTAELASLLPPALADALVGTFAVDVKHDSDQTVLEQARAMAAEAERAEELERVNQVMSAVAAGDRGVIGPEETVKAVVEGRAHQIVLLDDIECEGLECPKCDYMTVARVDACPACGEPAELNSNLLDSVIERAYLSGVELEFVSGDAKAKLLPQGGIGALLRY